MTENNLAQDIKFLPGVGPKRAELLNKECNIFTVNDLLNYFPYKYVDKTKFYQISEIHPNLPHVQVRGKIDSFRFDGPKYKQRLVARFSDETGSIELVWFQGIKWIQQNLQTGVEYIIFGKPGIFNNRINVIHPEIEDPLKQETGISSSLQAFYSMTEKLKNNYINSKTLQKLIQTSLQKYSSSINETLPDYLINHLQFLSREQAILNIHLPQSVELLRHAEYRLKFEELFYIQLGILRLRSNRVSACRGFKFEIVGKYFNSFYKDRLPFKLTKAQKDVMKEIHTDFKSGIQMNRLLQGDVGSGKTMVALMSMLIAADNGYQSCLMVPTEILAQQHYASITKYTEGTGITVGILTGSTKKKEREKIIEGLSSKTIHILIGTHALIEDPVQYSQLGLVIIDEQHRFGVAQRAKLWEKNSANPPHILVMTATPIPRTLAMTLYGDLDVSKITEMPPGRKPIQTTHYFDNSRLRVFGFLKKQIAEGRQVYIVYPLISESEKMDYKHLEDGFESITRAFPPPQYQVAVLHGKMKTSEKEKAMEYFKSGKAHIMIATTVIEVGVDVPNATVMVIESAERFGLSQLHQLRGRVGRGANQSYCILMSGYKLSEDGKKRLSTMVKTTDGFEIAEADLKLRGPGDLEGTQQSGMPFNLKIANLAKDDAILQKARNIANRILEDDPLLGKDKNVLLKLQIEAGSVNFFDWSSIS